MWDRRKKVYRCTHAANITCAKASFRVAHELCLRHFVIAIDFCGKLFLHWENSYIRPVVKNSRRSSKRVCVGLKTRRILNFRIFALINALWCLINAQLPPQLVTLTECVRVDCEIEWEIGKIRKQKSSSAFILEKGIHFSFLF